MMGKQTCPICEESFSRPEQAEGEDTNLCPKCHANRFFDSDAKEVKYRQYVNQITDSVKKIAQKDFDPNIHGRQIQQLARCEVQVEHYERMIDNNRETNDNVHKLLQNERVHLRAMYGILQTSLQAIRGDKRNVSHELPEDFRALLKQSVLESAVNE